jgi:GGDEF domain-containing protein
MISIKRFLTRTGDEAIFWQVICLLLEKIGSEAIEGDRSEYESFVRGIDDIRDSIVTAGAPETLLVTAGSAVQAMADYNRRVTRFIRRQVAEIQTIASMLTDTVIKMSGENSRFARAFQEIADSMEKVVAIEDIQNVKSRLQECLRDFHEETLQQKAEMENVIAALQEQVERSRERANTPADSDPATGLPRQDVAESVMFNNLKAGVRNYVVTLVINRMQSINARFGYRMGDRVLRTCKERIEKQLLPGDRMFRWSGPAIVLLLERSEPLDEVRGQVKRILETKMEETFDLGNRSVMIPISTSWSAFKLVSPTAVAVKQIQTFIASQSPRDYA